MGHENASASPDEIGAAQHSCEVLALRPFDAAQDRPALIRIETRAGHGAGKPTSKIIDEVADRWAFLVRALGMEVGT